MAKELLDVRNLSVHYKILAGWVYAVDNVSFKLNRGETMGLVGESGCGKTTTGYGITQLLASNAYIKDGSKVIFNGKDFVEMSTEPSKKFSGYRKIIEYHPEMRKYRWKHISMIFQGAMNAFNPVFKVGDQIIEAILTHEDITEEEARKRVEELYKLVGIPVDRIDNYPHEYSGGMKQRAMIAMALALNPDLIIADEPTTALDVVTQDKILGEMARLQKEKDVAMIIITHDVSVVAEMAHKMAVMYAGHLVETGTTRQIFKETAHPYMEALLKAFPSIKGEKRKLQAIPGSPPDLSNPPKGCRFAPRCPYAKDICLEEEPPVVEVAPGHFSKCHFAEELYGELGGEANE